MTPDIEDNHWDWPRKWHWLNDDFKELELDLVGFLAILGEGSLLSIAQVSALSPLFFLPRLLPAPQALMRPTRPLSLDTTPARVIGVKSGNRKNYIHHVAHVLLDRNQPKFSVRCVEVSKAENCHNVQARATGPLSVVTIIGFMLSVTLLVLSLVAGDGMSLYSVVLLSGLSTLIGIGNKWDLKLPSSPPDGAKSEQNVVIRYPNGAYLVVRCDEDIARELYFAPEEVRYKIEDETQYRLISLVGTLMLMLGVVTLGNATLPLQLAWGGAYIILNAAHWVAAALPKDMHWDLSRFEVKEMGIKGGPYNDNMTEALWKVILVTKNIKWIRTEEFPPATDVWQIWASDVLKEANRYTLGLKPAPLEHPYYDNQQGLEWDGPENYKSKDVWNELKRLDDERMRQEEQEEGDSFTAAPSVSQPPIFDTRAGAERNGEE